MGELITLNLKKSLSLDQLYERIKDYDLVLTVDAPLADALNARLKKPVLGHFATTPRRLALSELSHLEEQLEDKSELFLEIIDKTDINWKQTTYLLENVINCWKETGNAYKILDYKRFNTEDTERIIEILKKTINPYSAIEKYTLPEDTNLAVVAPHQFTSLDKKILPENYDEISPFTNQQTTLPSFNIYNSKTEIVETILDNLNNLDPKDVAVVMDKESQYRYLLESLFRSQDIPYMVSKDITEDETLRDFLNLIRASFYKNSLKVKDVKSFLKDTSDIDTEAEEYYIHSYQDDDLRTIKRLIQDIPEMTFKELLQNSLFDDKLDELKKHLDKLGFLDKKITLDRLNSITYYLETFDIKTETASRGILIASPGTSTFIDRPIVFYLGMDTSWTPEPPSTPWLDKREFDKKKIRDFKILLQNGEQQYFMVKDKDMNKDVTPSFYFNELTDQNIESFRDLKHTLRKKDFKEGYEQSFEKENIKAEKKETDMMSQSALNTFAYCPKDHFFSRLIDTPDKIYFRRGTVLHDFAEFYLNYPKLAEEKEKILDKMIEELSPFLNKTQIPTTKTMFDIGIQNIIEYLHLREPEIEEPEGYVKRYTDNIFADLFDKGITTSYTEVSFYNKDIGAKGKIDLILDHDHIVDFKTGSKDSINKIMSRSKIEDIDERPNFQAKMYIAHHRYHNPDQPICFTFYHLLDNTKDVISGSSNHQDNIVDIEYYPQEFNEITQKQNTFDWLQSSKRRKKVLNKLGYDNYRSFFEDKTIPELDKDELLKHPITIEFINYCKDLIGDYKYVEKGCKGIMKQLTYFRDQNYFRSDIDEFESFLQEQIKYYNECTHTNFPTGDVDPDEIENKDLVIL
ncbi:MAG: PD-(D/E)XK nuclease family protein [Thermoplasmata archaeon]